MHNRSIYLTPLILLCMCLCSNYTPSGISPGKIPSHPSHLAVLIAADLRVRTHAKISVKDTEGDSELQAVQSAGWRFESAGVGGLFCPSALMWPNREACSKTLELPAAISNAAATVGSKVARLFPSVQLLIGGMKRN